MKIRTVCTCPLEIVHDIMRGKWKTIIVFQLRNGGMGLAELERGIEGITQKMLLQHLGELRAFGLIGKIEPDGYPLRVTYFLRARGKAVAGRADHAGYRRGIHAGERAGRHFGAQGHHPCRRGHTHKKVTTVLSATCRYRGHNTRRYGMNTALLLIDIQNDYFPGGAWELSHADEAAAQARLALGRFREQHRPVFHVRHINTRPGAAFFLPDTPGSEIHGAVKPLDGEPAIIKHAPDAFFQTDLHDALSRAGIRKLVVSGMMSHMCIDTSVRAARNHGYDITLLHDACATRDLSWNGKTIPAATVHEAFMAALHGAFADVRTTGDFLPSLPA